MTFAPLVQDFGHTAQNHKVNRNILYNFATINLSVALNV